MDTGAGDALWGCLKGLDYGWRHSTRPWIMDMLIELSACRRSEIAMRYRAG